MAKQIIFGEEARKSLQTGVVGIDTGHGECALSILGPADGGKGEDIDIRVGLGGLDSVDKGGIIRHKGLHREAYLINAQFNIFLPR